MFGRILTLFFSLIVFTVSAQSQLTQTVRGTIMDDVLKTPLPGATIVILKTEPLLGAVSDPDGNFRIENVPVGTHHISISFVGYKSALLSNIVVNSGKETVLNIPLTEDATVMSEVVVKADQDKNKPLNDMAAVSARTFSVEESRRYAAAVNDPARMVSSFAGVTQTDDGSNLISIRGNSPFGLLWRMEGIDIPNPNHFAAVGSSGGGISILSAQLMSNSDFLTGAFPAEYGNALSGVFDIRLRKGNDEKRENTIQAGLLGIDLSTEGPLLKENKGSYLINYRYSTLSLLSKVGVNFQSGITNFQDLSWNIVMPAKRSGTFSFFGFGGLSSQFDDAVRDSLQWESEDDRFDFNYHSNTGAAGMKHQITLGQNVFIQSAILVSGNDKGFDQQRLDDDYVPVFDYDERFREKRITLSSVINYKASKKSYVRSGFFLNQINYDLYKRKLDDETDLVHTYLDSKGSGQLAQVFSQWNYRATEKFTFNTGLHYLYFFLNNTSSIEPRASVTYQASDRQSYSLGYGLHGQMQPIGVYFGQPLFGSDGTEPNHGLKFSQAHHLVVSFDRAVSRYLRVKAETYYQHLYHIPVNRDPTSAFSIINATSGYTTDSLTNKGVGRNYGLELTIEQFMHNNRYFLLSTSLYDSKYKALDNVWRNTRYNGNYTLTFTGGKDYVYVRGGKQKTLGFNIRTVYAGGLRSTPIDFQASIDARETKYIESKTYEDQLPAYFRTDLRISFTVNRTKTTSTLALDIQNVTNRSNIYGKYFDADSGTTKISYQTPLIPILSYKIEF